jgi:hypothetical protein
MQFDVCQEIVYWLHASDAHAFRYGLVLAHMA